MEWIGENLSCAPGGYRCLFAARDGWSTFRYFVLILFHITLLSRVIVMEFSKISNLEKTLLLYTYIFFFSTFDSKNIFFFTIIIAYFFFYVTIQRKIF